MRSGLAGVAEARPQSTHCDAPGVWHVCGCEPWPRNSIGESSWSTLSLSRGV